MEKTPIENKKIWYRCYFPKALLLRQTEKAVAINLPDYSEFNNYYFWLPIGMVKQVDNETSYYSFSIPEDFGLNINKANKYKEVIDRISLKPEEVNEIFKPISKHIRTKLKNVVTDKNIINLQEIMILLANENISTQYIADKSTLSKQTIANLRELPKRLYRMKLENVMLLQEVVRIINYERINK